MFFAIKSSVPINNFSIYEDKEPVKGKKAKGVSMKGLVSFEKSPGTIFLKVGISPVSSDNALKNIQSEIPKWDFEEIAKQADEKWNKELSKIDPVDWATRCARIAVLHLSKMRWLSARYYVIFSK